MKIKLHVIAWNVERPEFHFEKFIFCQSSFYSISNRYVFSLIGVFQPANVCRRLEKYFGELDFRCELNFDGYESYECCLLDEFYDEDDYEDFYES